MNFQVQIYGELVTMPKSDWEKLLKWLDSQDIGVTLEKMSAQPRVQATALPAKRKPKSKSSTARRA